MKKFGMYAGLLLLAVAAINAFPQVRRAEAYGYQTMRVLSKGAPGIPTTAAMPAAGDGICARVTAGADVEVTCNSDTACYYRAVTSFGATDGGFPTVLGGNGTPDGGFAKAGADNYLLQAKVIGPVRFHLSGSNDAICAVTADGGTLAVSVVSQ